MVDARSPAVPERAGNQSGVTEVTPSFVGLRAFTFAVQQHLPDQVSPKALFVLLFREHFRADVEGMGHFDGLLHAGSRGDDGAVLANQPELLAVSVIHDHAAVDLVHLFLGHLVPIYFIAHLSDFFLPYRCAAECSPPFTPVDTHSVWRLAAIIRYYIR